MTYAIRPLVAGNWKMNGTNASLNELLAIGHGFMGAAHSQGWRVAPRFFDLPREPEMTVVVGRDAAGVAANARKWGWAETATDWREVIARDDIDVVDIVTPGDTHAEIAIAALEAAVRRRREPRRRASGPRPPTGPGGSQ